MSSQAAKRTTPETTPLQGEIHAETIPRLFHDFSATKASGLLIVTDREVRKSVEFSSGRVLFASSTDREDRLIQFLLKAGVVSLANLLKALEVSIATKDRLGEVLVGRKMISQAEVDKWVKVQVRDIVLSLFQWWRGSYSFAEKEAGTEPVTISLPGDLMVIEGVRRITSWVRIYEQVGGLNTEYRSTREADRIARDLSLQPEEKDLIKLCDTPTSLGEMCEGSKLTDFEVCRTVWALLLVGALMKS
ncbi:MAG TPA: DUF4388 domain-containing protein [Candidatus Polarisedimenticolia bacterium]|nr:DUF4388 domain-containing protein [Candidatus Polarisedimenticolia bacterium]